MTKVVFMFGGQGSQHYQMGRALYDRHPTFRRWMHIMDEQVRDLSGQSVLAALYHPSNDKGIRFDATELTHPAIFMVEYALAQTLLESGVEPDMMLSASLGTFAACAVGGALPMADALTLVLRQVASLKEHAAPGGMIAMLGPPSLHEGLLAEHSDLAAFNYGSHVVLSALLPRLDDIEAELRQLGVAFQRLPVGYPYHSRWLDPVQPSFMASTKGIVFGALRIPLACCACTGVTKTVSPMHLWDVLRRPIQLESTVRVLEKEGPFDYVDVSPASTLATLLRYAISPSSRSRIRPVMSPFGRDVENLGAASIRVRGCT